MKCFHLCIHGIVLAGLTWQYGYSQDAPPTTTNTSPTTWPSFDELRRAAEQGDSVAQCNLGNSYHKGNGIDKDEREAVKWYRKAA